MKKTTCILVIDANRESIEHYRRLLQAEDYGVEISTFREITPEEVERWHPDLVVFDLLVDAVQEQQAWQFIRQFKASPQLASLPVLICAAALVLPGFPNYAQDQHIPVLFKPLDLQRLVGVIRTFLTLSHLVPMELKEKPISRYHPVPEASLPAKASRNGTKSMVSPCSSTEQ